MDNTPGTDPLEGGSSDWVLLEAPDDGEGDSEEEYDEEFDRGEDLVDFIDDSVNVQDVSDSDFYRRLQVEQQREDDQRAAHVLKRKFLDSPKTKADSDLSPRLEAISLQERSGRARRKLYKNSTVDDSGHGDSLEASCLESLAGRGEQVPISQSAEPWEGATPTVVCTAKTAQEVQSTAQQEDYTSQVTQLMQAGKPRNVLLALCKDAYGCSFSDLTRSYKSDKTVCGDWVCLIAGVPCSLEEAITDLLKPHSDYTHVNISTCRYGLLLLLLVRWKTAKCRETVQKLLGGLMSVEKHQMVLEPPKIRHPATAMFWYKRTLANASVVTGETPEWILKQVSLQEQIGAAATFSLSAMVQWAYDNGLEGESEIAYGYAQLAEEDTNAEAFLRSNAQAKHVKDCAIMVRHYRRAEMCKMNIAQWIKLRCSKVEGEGDWRPIMKFLKFQKVEILAFLTFMRHFLRGTPKRNCMVLLGPPNTGKSLFGMSLMHFLGGKIISHVNSGSHFWLQPLLECKVAMLDDATTSTWDYMDIYLRNMLDGNTVCLDAKHKAPMQLKCPPLIVTTNVDVTANDKWKYLHSRLKVFTFPNLCPLNCRGDPEFQLTPENWKAFLEKCWTSLGLEDLLKDGDGEPLQPLRCAARAADGTD
ncbi:E1 protein [Omikronpapillomavirus 1]|uniref:Replication protein E1 n=1 Tax=Phocoena spinipinnis papillomavirus (isolate Burmeister's porpoise/Peru/PsPV1) TaxID=654916 RepID=Q8UZ18_PSPVP|nr:E1 protein [Omikronpapillomavirus 1]CAC80270.1 E1 protein [Omikronpapillomavirus 1]